MSVNNEVQIEKWSCINSFFQQLFDVKTLKTVKTKSETGLSFKCLLCLPKQKIVSASQSSNANLRTHIKLVHSHRLNDFNAAFKKRNCDDINTLKHSKQLKLSEVGQNSIKKLTQTEFNNANLKLIINTVSPFSLIEHPAFIDYCKVTSSKVPVSRRTLMRDIEILFNSLIEELKMEFKTVEYVCLTADCWTVFHKAYIGVTVHWLDNNLERHSKALACRRMFGRHTYDNIAEILDRIINEFHLQNKITLIVTDNASNFVKAFKIFNENSEITEIPSNEDENEEVVRSVEIFDILDNDIVENLDCLTLPPHQRCAAHTLNLIATVDILAAENEGAYKRISRRLFGKCQSLFNKQNQSSQSADQIKAILGRYLLTPNATRWNSFYDSINLLCENIEKMDDVCAKFQVPFFTKPQDVDFLNKYCKVMKPIARGLDILQGDKQISIGFLLPTISAINRAYDHIVNLKYCKPLVRALSTGLSQRFQRYTTCDNCQMAAVLVPKFKLNWAKPQEKIDIRQRLIDYLIENIGEEDSVYTASQTSLAIEQHTESESEDDFLSFNVTATSSDNENIQILVDNYLSNTSIKSPNDLSMQLKKAYSKFNTAIPSSAPVERLFSGGGHLMDKKRGKMADKNFEMTLLLKHNKYLKC